MEKFINNELGDCTVSSTGWVNYFPSDERTARQIEAAYGQLGDDIVLLDGEDDWYAPAIFHVTNDCDAAGIEVIGRIHTGISGISQTGAVIKKEDLPKFIQYCNDQIAEHPEIKRSSWNPVKYYDRGKQVWIYIWEKTKKTA